jgi:hypothetical protein
MSLLIGSPSIGFSIIRDRFASPKEFSRKEKTERGNVQSQTNPETFVLILKIPTFGYPLAEGLSALIGVSGKPVTTSWLLL